MTCCQHRKNMPGVRVIGRSTERGISTNPGEVRWNLNTGAAAINLSVHFGVRRIVLLGFDMRPTEIEIEGEKVLMNNWHQDYPHSVAKAGRKQRDIHNPYPNMLERFAVIAQDLKRLGVECLNATEGSAIEAFPRLKLEDLLA